MAALALLCAAVTLAQVDAAPDPGRQSDASSLHRYYDEAYRLESSGEYEQADVQHVLFLVAALDHLADGYANNGDYQLAVPAFEEALALAPADYLVLRDFAGAAMDTHDLDRAKSLLKMALDVDSRTTSAKEKADLHRMLGGVHMNLGENAVSIEHFQAAVSLDPSLENLTALADAQLAIQGSESAAATFAMVITRFGDTAENHLRIGRIYGLGGDPEDAVAEFKRAIALDDDLPGIHYSLGVTYMALKQKDYADAEVELRKELARYPDDKLTYSQLGAIARARQDLAGAVTDYEHAAELNPQDSDNFLELGKLFVELKQPADAETALRKAIELTTDPARNHYAIAGAHYRLGRLLMANGNKTEGAHELEVSEELLAEYAKRDESLINGGAVARSSLGKVRAITPEEAAEVKDFEEQIKPLIAAGYNNLGVHAARNSDFPKAAGYFRLAAKWNPSLPGVERNWARAAFAAHQCGEAVGPLRRSIAADPTDPDLQTMLDRCEAILGNVPRV